MEVPRQKCGECGSVYIEFEDDEESRCPRCERNELRLTVKQLNHDLVTEYWNGIRDDNTKLRQALKDIRERMEDAFWMDKSAKPPDAKFREGVRMACGALRTIVRFANSPTAVKARANTELRFLYDLWNGVEHPPEERLEVSWRWSRHWKMMTRFYRDKARRLSARGIEDLIHENEELKRERSL